MVVRRYPSKCRPSHVLPSLNLAYDLTSDLLLRGAVAKVISRPAYADLGSQQNLNYYSAAWAAQRIAFGDHEGWSGRRDRFRRRFRASR